MSDQAMAAVQNLVITQAAAGTGADVTALIDSTTFRSVIDSFDATATDYHQKVSAAIIAAVAGDARFQAPATRPPEAPAGPAPTGDSAGPAAAQQWTDADVQRSSPAEVAAALNSGLLAGLGMSPSRRHR
jgi:hypothetical protein